MFVRLIKDKSELEESMRKKKCEMEIRWGWICCRGDYTRRMSAVWIRSKWRNSARIRTTGCKWKKLSPGREKKMILNSSLHPDLDKLGKSTVGSQEDCLAPRSGIPAHPFLLDSSRRKSRLKAKLHIFETSVWGNLINFSNIKLFLGS